MPDVSVTNLLVVAAVAVLAPMTVGFAPRLRIPAVVLEVIGGIIIGPSGFGWVRVDLPVQILALFCAGLLSVLIFPLIALGLLRRDEPGPAAVPDVTAPIAEPHLM